MDEEDYGAQPLTMADYYGGNPAASYTYMNADFPTAGGGYDANPLAATSPDGGAAWRPGTYVPYNGNTNPIFTGQWSDPAAQAGMLNAYLPQNPVASPGGSRVTSGRPPGDVSQMGKPYAGGAGSYMTNAGYQPLGQMPSQLMDLYKNFLSNPSAMMDTPMFKALMDQSLQATERKGLSQGFMNSGNMAQALQQTGMGTAAGYLGQLADMYKGGAGMEASRYTAQSGANQNAGQLGLQQYGAEAGSQLNNARANYGAGQDFNAQLQSAQAQSPVQQLMTMMLMKQLQGG